MVIIKQPGVLNLSGNLPDLLISDPAAVELKLYQGADLILTETYQPDADDNIRIVLKDIIDGLLSIQIPSFDDVTLHQSTGYADFTATLNDVTDVAFRVVKGGVDSDGLDVSEFLAANFLTWQPQQKTVQYHDPEWLTYYAAAAVTIKAKGYYDASDETISIATLAAGQLVTLGMNYGQLISLFTDQPLYIDVWAELDAVRLSFIQRYILSDEDFQYNDVFVCENSLGGIDTMRFTGELKAISDFEFKAALFDEETRDFFSAPIPAFEKNSGLFRSSRERMWSEDFFKSLQKYYLFEGDLKRVRITKLSLQSVNGLPASYTFNFTWSKQNKYLNLSRADSLPEDLQINGPAELSVIPPRLNEFPVPALTNILFPVQKAYDASWYQLSLNQLLSQLGLTLATEAGVTQFLTSSFTVKNDSASYAEDGADVLITDLKLKGKSDYPVYSTQIGGEWRKADLTYDAEAATVRIANFSLQDGEHITINPGGTIEIASTGMTYPEIIARIETLESIAAPFMLTGASANGGMVLWNRPALDIPAGWQEVEDWRGRLAMGWDPDDPDFDTVGEENGSKVFNIQKTNLPAVQIDVPIPGSATSTTDSGSGRIASGNDNFDSGGGTLKTAALGDGTAIKHLNPYRIVVFIEYVGT